MSKRTAETNRVWVVTVNSANVTGLISFSGLYSTGQRLTTGLSMVNCVPPIIAMPADHDLTKENVVKFVNEHRRDYGTKLRGRKFEEKDVSIYSEETLIKMADDKNLGVTASTAKRARKTAIDDDSIQLGIAGLFDGAEEGEVVGDAPPRLPDDHGGSAAGDAANDEHNSVLFCRLVKQALSEIDTLKKRVDELERMNEAVHLKTIDDTCVMYCFYQKDADEDFLQRCKRLFVTFDLPDVAHALVSATRLTMPNGELYHSAKSELKFSSPEMAAKLIENKNVFVASKQTDEQKRDFLYRLKRIAPQRGRDIDIVIKTERVSMKKAKSEPKPTKPGIELF